MNKYRIIEIKDHLGFAWYVPQRFCLNCWQDISSGWNKKEAAMESIRRDITQTVVWEGTEEDVLRSMRECQKLYGDD
jgi:hypothetical protein